MDPLRIDIRFSVALRVGRARASTRERLLVSHLLTRALGPAFRRDLWQDFPIWEHKVYVDQPRLAKGDGPIAAYRRWAQQFYAPQSATNGHAPAATLSAG